MNLNNIILNPLLDTLKLKKISDEEYFSSKYEHCISNSRLGLINPNQDGSPEKFFGGFAKNKIYSNSLVLGSRLHEFFLQPEYFSICNEVNRPSGKVGHIADLLAEKENITDEDFVKAAIEIDYYKGLLTENRLLNLKNEILPYLENKKKYDNSDGEKVVRYLDNSTREKFYKCLNSLNNNDEIQKLIKPQYLLNEPIVENEWAILLDIEARVENEPPIVLSLKSKIDNYTICKDENLMTINDLKTTSGLVCEFSNAINRYRYHREMAMYSWLLSLCLNKFYNIKDPIIKSNFLVIETRHEHESSVFKMNKRLFVEGFEEFKTLLKMAAYYKVFGYETL